tara:strand:+ start:3710 stop:4783 length:1074 start_codon:yes stop_codon:yes gene_type:complete
VKVRFRHLDPRGNIVFCNLDEREKRELGTVDTKSQKIDKRLRAGRLQNKSGETFVFTSDDDLVSSSKRFKFFCETLGQMVEAFIDSQSDYLDDITSNTNRLIHNLTTLNAVNLQQIYSVFPQENLTRNIGKSVDVIEEIVKNEPKSAARCIMNLTKNTIATRTEFSVYQKMFEKQPSLQQRTHNVHKVLMNILYVFFPDFTDKDVRIPIHCEGTISAFFDYESVQVVLHHLIENAAKYTLSGSDMSIRIDQKEAGVLLEFEMVSLAVDPEEYQAIFSDGYSGIYPKKTGKSGRGIGLNIAKRLLELNNGWIEFACDLSTRTDHFGVPYQLNVFRIGLPNQKHRRDPNWKKSVLGSAA